MSATSLFLSTGNFNNSTVVHANVSRNTAFVVNTGTTDNEIDFAGSEGLDGMSVDIVKPREDRSVFSFGLYSLLERARRESGVVPGLNVELTVLTQTQAEKTSVKTSFSDQAVGLTMCRQCAVGATSTSSRNCTPSGVLSSTSIFQGDFERMTKDTTVTAPSTIKIKWLLHRMETSSLLAPNASIAQKCCRQRCSPSQLHC